MISVWPWSDPLLHIKIILTLMELQYRSKYNFCYGEFLGHHSFHIKLKPEHGGDEGGCCDRKLKSRVLWAFFQSSRCSREHHIHRFAQTCYCDMRELQDPTFSSAPWNTRALRLTHKRKKMKDKQTSSMFLKMRSKLERKENFSEWRDGKFLWWCSWRQKKSHVNQTANSLKSRTLQQDSPNLFNLGEK